MIDFIGMPLDEVVDILEQQNQKYTIVQNNFCVNGDTRLVTNVKAVQDKIILTVGDFIFDLKEDL